MVFWGWRGVFLLDFYLNFWDIYAIYISAMTKINNKKEAFKKIIFGICLVVCIAFVGWLLLTPFIGVYCNMCGFNGGGGGSRIYGLSGLMLGLLYVTFFSCCIPIFSLSLMYVIFYLSKRRKKQDKK